MRKFLTTALCLLPILALGACQNARDYETAGTLGGGALGGAIGNSIGDGKGQIIATIGGALVGLFTGNMVGRAMAPPQPAQQGYVVAPASGQPPWQCYETYDSYNGRQRYCNRQTYYSELPPTPLLSIR